MEKSEGRSEERPVSKRKPGGNTRLTDIHSHLLPGVDDGVETMEEASLLLKSLKDKGIDKIFLTPHLNHPIIPTTSRDILEVYELYKEKLKESGIEVLIGSELFLSPGFPTPIPLEGTSFVLVELPTLDFPYYLEEAIFELQLSGYDVILAHVERYAWLLEKKSLIERLKDRGVYFQVNVIPLARKDKNALWYYGNNLIDFLGTDLHSKEELEELDFGFQSYSKLFEHFERFL
ncbi:MAG: protein-tyrosine phosphatase [Thermotogota bacterium]|nr:protein-tyrosine phosphatase [Thermotogota bacterium]